MFSFGKNFCTTKKHRNLFLVFSASLNFVEITFSDTVSHLATALDAAAV